MTCPNYGTFLVRDMKGDITKDKVYRAYDRLVREEKQQDPIRFYYLSRDYYAEKILCIEDIGVTSKEYVKKLLKRRYKQ